VKLKKDSRNSSTINILVILQKCVCLNSKNKNSSTLHEKAGISPPEIISTNAVVQIQKLRKVQPSSQELIDGILKGSISSLSRAITLIESSNTNHLAKANEVINACLPHANKSIRVGITGVPGVGKSTFIEAFGKHLTGLGKKVAVLAIDPSSMINNGSILGDKTRMEELVKDKNAYIRPSASGETLGGVARKTRETITLCEAAGFNTILVETVGVGQSETAVHSMTDFFLLLKISGAGDELQGIKRGIMEMADAIIINKADGDNLKKANLAKTEFNRALHLFPAKLSRWIPKVSTCSSITHEGIPEVWNMISQFLAVTQNNGFFHKNRKEQNQYWLLETINEQLKTNFYSNPKIQELLEANKKAVEKDEISPFTAAQIVIDNYFKNKNL